MTRVALSALLSHWRKQPMQAIALVLGLALATALWTGVQAINTEARKSYADAATALGGGGETRLEHRAGQILSDADFVTLRRAGWQVTPVLEGWISGEGGRVRLIGLDPLSAPADTRAAAAVLAGETEGFFGAEAVLLAAPATAARLGALSGASVVALDDLAPGIAFADIGVAQRLLDQPGAITSLIVLEDQPRTRLALA